MKMVALMAALIAVVGSALVAALSAGTAAWMKIRSPHTIGVDDPDPGSFTFHFTFFDSLHSTGGCASGEAPVDAGPRHAGHGKSADANDTSVRQMKIIARAVPMYRAS